MGTLMFITTSLTIWLKQKFLGLAKHICLMLKLKAFLVIWRYTKMPPTLSQGIKAHFNIDDSGLLHVTGVESVFEKTITVEEQEKAEAERVAKEEAEKAKSNKTETGEQETEGETKEGEEDSWAKLGDTISSYFGGDEEKKSEG